MLFFLTVHISAMLKSIKLNIFHRKRPEKCVLWTKWYELWVAAVTQHTAKRAACESGNYAIVLASERQMHSEEEYTCSFPLARERTNSETERTRMSEWKDR